MKRFKLTHPLIAILTCSMMFSTALSQDKKKSNEDLIKISAELVQVDVLVLDKENKPVGGLKKEDFELFDNDKQQTVSFFSFEESKLRQVEQDDEPRTLPRVITPGELKRVVAFVVDTLHMKTESIYRSRQMLLDFIDKKMEPGDLVLILPSGGGSGLYQQFTADQRVLRTAVNNLRPAFILDEEGPARRGSSEGQAIALLPTLAERGRSAPGGGPGAPVNVGDPLEETDVRMSLGALNSTIEAMSKFPGRKIGVFVSEGLRTFRTQAETLLTETSYKAARANVVFYTIAAGGLDTVGLTATEQQGLRGPLDVDANSPTGFATPSLIQPTTTLRDKRADYLEAQDALARLANETGGKFYKNNNDIKTGLSSLLQENSGYYLLGFQPESGRWDGKFHKLKVLVKNRPDLIVTTRKGYLAKTLKTDQREVNSKASELAEAMSSPLVRRDIDVLLTPFYRDDAKREPILTTMLHIDASKLNFKLVDGFYKDKLVLTGVMVDRMGKLADSFSNSVDLNFEAKDFDGVKKDGLLSTRAISVKPGNYQVRILVREADSGILGTATSYVEVPNIKGDQLSASSIFTDAGLMQRDKAGDAIGGASSISHRQFPRNGQFAYVLIVYNAKADDKTRQPQIDAKARILRNGVLVFAGKEKPAEILEGSTPPGRLITGGIMQLTGLKPGEYTLELTLTDKLRKKDATLRQEIAFSVQ
jgi:VWFA-related protein